MHYFNKILFMSLLVINFYTIRGMAPDALEGEAFCWDNEEAIRCAASALRVNPLLSRDKTITKSIEVLKLHLSVKAKILLAHPSEAKNIEQLFNELLIQMSDDALLGHKNSGCENFEGKKSNSPMNSPKNSPMSSPKKRKVVHCQKVVFEQNCKDLKTSLFRILALINSIPKKW